LGRVSRRVLCECRHGNPSSSSSSRGLKKLVMPPTYHGVEYPERSKLRFMEKVPQYPAAMRPPKMKKNLHFMRAPEPFHHSLIHQQYGIVALAPGRLHSGHFEMLRLTLGRKLDTSRMFAIWRVDPPWQPVTKKGQGKRMGGGKGSIDHYVTPVKTGRIIIELGGHVEFAEVKPMLKEVADKLPFKAKAVSKQILEEDRQKEVEDERNNINPFTLEYIIKNAMGGVHHWGTKAERKWFGKYQ